MSRPRRIRTLLADDHAIVRQGLRAILEAEPDMEVLGEAADGREAVRKALALVPDVVVMDVSMPRLNGVEATLRIVKKRPDIKIVALTMHDSEAYVCSMLQAGARGYLQKESVSSDLVEAIRTVVKGRTYLHPSLPARVVESALKQPRTKGRSGEIGILSSREREVLQLIAEGNTNKEIAVILDLAVKTIESHRTRIMDKLEIHNASGLTRYAIGHGMAIGTTRTAPPRDGPH